MGGGVRTLGKWQPRQKQQQNLSNVLRAGVSMGGRGDGES